MTKRVPSDFKPNFYIIDPDYDVVLGPYDNKDDALTKGGDALPETTEGLHLLLVQVCAPLRRKSVLEIETEIPN